MCVLLQCIRELFVSRIPWTVANKEVKEYFTQFGTVKKCLLPFDKETGFHRGYCWVTFAAEEGLLNALQKDTHLLEGGGLKDTPVLGHSLAIMSDSIWHRENLGSSTTVLQTEFKRLKGLSSEDL
ncbi:SRA stem-loop-interacting RNA-binding protein, mitochondrial-like [Bombina bombina]|uniref:SRA stem-loop-interacting RNA-binding protein, mitochondrial-like n=1 Tax=Bombina bombina TaxID=8345 RepID=UPI00235AD933|nr:SRA stem-loop-interacting RNA-binding protein, mitochondrial-like [Bombina bombina]